MRELGIAALYMLVFALIVLGVAYGLYASWLLFG